MVTEVTDQNFVDETSEGVVLTDFWATWCGPCKMQSPVVDKLAEEMDEVKFVKMDVDENQKTPQEFGSWQFLLCSSRRMEKSLTNSLVTHQKRN